MISNQKLIKNNRPGSQQPKSPNDCLMMRSADSQKNSKRSNRRRLRSFTRLKLSQLTIIRKPCCTKDSKETLSKSILTSKCSQTHRPVTGRGVKKSSCKWALCLTAIRLTWSAGRLSGRKCQMRMTPQF